MRKIKASSCVFTKLLRLFLDFWQQLHFLKNKAQMGLLNTHFAFCFSLFISLIKLCNEDSKQLKETYNNYPIPVFHIIIKFHMHTITKVENSLCITSRNNSKQQVVESRNQSFFFFLNSKGHKERLICDRLKKNKWQAIISITTRLNYNSFYKLLDVLFVLNVVSSFSRFWYIL